MPWLLAMANLPRKIGDKSVAKRMRGREREEGEGRRGRGENSPPKREEMGCNRGGGRRGFARRVVGVESGGEGKNGAEKR